MSGASALDVVRATMEYIRDQPERVDHTYWVSRGIYDKMLTILSPDEINELMSTTVGVHAIVRPYR